MSSHSHRRSRTATVRYRRHSPAQRTHRLTHRTERRTLCIATLCRPNARNRCALAHRHATIRPARRLRAKPPGRPAFKGQTTQRVKCQSKPRPDDHKIPFLRTSSPSPKETSPSKMPTLAYQATAAAEKVCFCKTLVSKRINFFCAVRSDNSRSVNTPFISAKV